MGDIQSRLVLAGYLDSQAAELEECFFGEETEQAIRAFQQEKGLIVDGIVGPDTWRHLVEASRSLGSRFLYLREPPLRGDDVADLQRRLNALGFYSGKESGIFNEETANAVEQFQKNFGLHPDGIAGTKTVQALLNLSRITRNTSVAFIKESEKGLPSMGIEGRRIMLDPGHGFPPDPGAIGPSGLMESEAVERIADRLAEKLSNLGAVVVLSRPPSQFISERKRASRANELMVDLVLSIHTNSAPDPKASGACSYYFASGDYRSPYGYRLANHIQDELTENLHLRDCRAHGRAFPLLRETRMPVVVTEPVFISNKKEELLLRDEEFLSKLASSLSLAIQKYFAGYKSRAEISSEPSNE